MQAGGFQGIDNAVAAGPCQANDIALDAGLRDQELEESLHVCRRLLDSISTGAAAFAVAAAVDCERVDSSGRQLAGHVVPGGTCAVGLMEEQDAWARLSSGEVAG